jgi:molybdopterin synthase catalytic subunit
MLSMTDVSPLCDGDSVTPTGAVCIAELCPGPVDLVDLDWPGECGAQCDFMGRTRHEGHEEFGPLLRLEYEVYGPMAQATLTKMVNDAAERFDCRCVRVVHAHGPVAPGQASVVIQVATPHRGESFEACRYLIERIKHELPIWKRQIWQHGETFNEGCCAQPFDPQSQSDGAEEHVHG